MTRAFLLLLATLCAACALVGAVGGVWWENRPADWPNVPVLFWRLGFGDGLRAQLGEARAQVAAYAAADRAAAVHAKVVEAREAAVSAETVTAETRAEARISTVYRTIAREIPVVIPLGVDRAFALSAGFVRVHDAALGTRLSAAAPDSGQPDDAASPVAESAAAAVIAANYGDCRADQERLAAFQAWARGEGLAK